MASRPGLTLERALFAGSLSALLASVPLFADQTVQVGPGNTFSPSTVTVAPGEAVIWNFQAFHTSTSDATTGPEVWDSGFLTSGTFSHNFTTPGTYPYYCQVHSVPGGTMMNGVVVVLGGATPTATSTIPQATPSPISTSTATPTIPQATPSPISTSTATPTIPQATPSPISTSTAKPTIPQATPSPISTSTATPTLPSEGTPAAPGSGIPTLDLRGRILFALILAAAGLTALSLAGRR
jgi:plastocyanin